MKRLLAGGVLTAVAAGVFFVGAPSFRSAGNDNGGVTQLVTQEADRGATIMQEGNIYPAVTKDNQMLRITMDIRPRDSGQIAAENYESTLKDYATLHLMAQVRKYDLKDIPANIAKIQQDVASEITASLPVSAEGGVMTQARVGVNFDAPVISKVEDARGTTVIYPTGARGVMSRFGL